MSIKDISMIFANNCNYKNINNRSNIKMRNIPNGITLLDAINFRFLYTFLNTTKQSNTSNLNYKNNTNYDRSSYESKENNIPSFVYLDIFNDLNSYYNSHFRKKDNLKIIACDGTYNRTCDHFESLNMGIFDITNSIPIDLQSFGIEGKNREIKSIKQIILNDLSKFKKTILVADRGYFSYKFIDFLIENKIKFIIRAKGDAANLSDNNVIKNTPLYKDIIKIKNKIRIVRCESTFDKTIYLRDSKNKYKRNVNKLTKSVITVKNDCILITNLLNNYLYSDNKCLDLYRSRWDVEVFFRFVKETYKFSFLKESNKNANYKSYLCILITELLVKIIVEKFLLSQNKKLIDCKINHSNLIKGLNDTFLMDIIYDKISDELFIQFCKSYISFVKIIKNRSYPRISKRPFSKWYVKNFSITAAYQNIINAILNKCLDKLNKNLKNIAKKIVKIDGKKCNITGT